MTFVDDVSMSCNDSLYLNHPAYSTYRLFRTVFVLTLSATL